MEPPDYRKWYDQSHDIRDEIRYNESDGHSTRIVTIGLDRGGTGPPVDDIGSALEGKGKRRMKTTARSHHT